MITRLEVDGFKSLRAFAVDFEPLTVLVGPNSAGKSNVLDALALVSRLASLPVEEAFKQGRGRALDQFTRRGGEAGSTIRFAVELLLGEALLIAAPDVRCNRYRYEVAITRVVEPSGAERLTIADERVLALDHAGDRWSTLRPDQADQLTHAPAPLELLRPNGVRARVRRLFAGGGTELDLIGVPKHRTALSALASGTARYRVGVSIADSTGEALDAIQSALGLRSRGEAIDLLLDQEAERRGIPIDKDALSAIADELGAYRLFRLDSARLREPSERLGSDTLAPDAANLPTVLASLPAPTLGEIRADLASLVPGIATFEVVPDGDAFRIDFELSGGERLPARLVSDGTLRVLALLTALRVAPKPGAIGVEEPENGVYPGRLRKLLDYLDEIAADEASAPPQLILTTHSPVILAGLRLRPRCLRYIDLVRRDGQLVTRARPVSPTPGPDRGQLTISLREIDELLHAAESETGR